jgi:hypothetical protein
MALLSANNLMLGNLGQVLQEGGDAAMTKPSPEQEIDTVDRRAFEMAQAVLRDPGLRGVLFDEADRLAKRLVEANEELERTDPAAHEEREHQVSEATMDLFFTRFETEMCSPRLNRLRRPEE